MGRKITDKILRKMKIETLRKIVQYRNSSNITIKSGAITNIDQMEFLNGDVVSQGNDPKMFVYFYKPIKKLHIEYQIESKDKNDTFELFFSDVKKKKVDFSYDECYKIGRLDDREYHRNIIFKTPVKHLRIDLGQHSGDIKLKKMVLTPLKETNESDYDEYTDILDSIQKDNNKKKILIVTHGLNNTGAPILAYNISQKFLEKNYDVVVISLSDGNLEEKFEKLRIPLINLHQSIVSKTIYDNETLDKIIKVLSEKGYENAITNTIVSGVVAPYLKKYNFKIISLIHEMKTSILANNMQQGGRDINMYSDLIIFPDKIVHDGFTKLFNETRKNWIVRPQGVYRKMHIISKDPSKLYSKYNIPTNAKIILGSGYADIRKGIDLFVAAGQQLLKLEKDENYHFVWAGNFDFELKSWLETQINLNGLQERFHFIEFIEDKKDYQNLVECSSAFWLTSREDPFPSVMFDAMDCSVPVFAFKNTGGANTLLSDDKGVLIENLDSQSLALKTYELLNDKEKCDSIILKAKKYIEKNFSFDDYIDDLETQFNVLDEKKKKYKYADVSVIVPNYNYEKELPIRLNSIINQTIKPKEIIFLDDVSKDNSIKIVEPILKKAKKIYNIDTKVIKNETNNGCFKQWLKGIKIAKYPYVWIAEADDYAKKNFIETLMPKFDDQEVTLAYAKSHVIDETGKVVDYDYNSYLEDFSTTKWTKDFIEDGLTQIKKYFSQKNIIPNVSSTIIRKSATKGIEKILENYKMIGDWPAYIHIISTGKIAYVSKELNGHRRHSKSIIAKTEKSVKYFVEILKVKQYVANNFELTDNELINMLLSIRDLEFFYEKCLKDREYAIVLKECIDNIVTKLRKKNLLIVLPDFNVGGGQTVGIRIANNMTKHYNVFLVNARSELVTNYMEDMISKDINVLEYNNNVKNLIMFNKIFKFKSVISFIWWSDKLTYYAYGNENINWIISMHGCYEMMLHHPEVDEYFEKNVHQMLDRANSIVYTAEKNKEILLKYNLTQDKKVHKIDNGFDLGSYSKKSRKELNIKDSDFVFGLVARAIKEKGYEEAIEAINIVNKNSPKKAHLVLLGNSDYIDNLKVLNENNKYIHFVDQFNEPNEWLGWEEIFDVGLLPSYFKSESLPTVIIEYLFLNKPVIATDIAEIKSMIENDKNKAGITIPLKDGKADIEKLANAMLLLMNNKDVYNECKKNTTLFAKRFSMEKCIKEYRNLIEGESSEKQ